MIRRVITQVTQLILKVYAFFCQISILYDTLGPAQAAQVHDTRAQGIYN